MKKIRINELARELEVKAHEILDRLPELGVQEKKTHSSSIDEDVAIKLRRLYGFPVDDDAERSLNGGSPRTIAQAYDGPDEAEPPATPPAVPVVTPEPPAGPAPAAVEATPEPTPEKPVETHTPA